MKMWQYRLIWLWRDIKRTYYRLFHGIHTGEFDGTPLPALGKGQFVSVYRRGSYIDVQDEEKPRMVRIIPSQYSHGVMLEIWEGGHIRCRGHLEMKQMAALMGCNWEFQSSMVSTNQDERGE